MADTVLTELKMHVFDTAEQLSQYESEIGDNDLVFTPDLSCRLPLLSPMWFDHIANDVSWLRADTFSWHSGSFYESAYKHLADELKTEIATFGWVGDTTGIVYATKGTPSVGDSVIGGGYTVGEVGSDYIAIYKNGVEYEYATRNSEYDGTEDASKTDTIGDITITYYTAEDGHKICLPDQESNLVALYESTGVAWYYLLDTANKQFKLPRKQKRRLIQAVKNTDGTWYNLYSDGWVEQGGRGKTNVSVSLPVAMTDSNYVVLVENHVRVNGGTGASDMTTTSFIPRWQQYNASGWGTGNHDVSWQVSGYAAESEYASAGMRLEYYYVGNFEQSAVEQTAGITSETLSNKADIDLGNIPSNYDYVVAEQEPTSDNNSTWYREYKSGWVEQGGMWSTSEQTSATKSITLPVEMKDGLYWADVSGMGKIGNQGAYVGYSISSRTTTQLKITVYNSASGKASWMVKGYKKVG